jgi:pimeloyl-ACP methyl ester carboxylesterase
VRARLTALVAMAVVFVVSSPRAEAASCPSGASCGTVSVPLDWADPSRGSLPIAYALFAHRQGAEPTAGTLVPLTGGPGGSNTAFPNDWLQLYGPLLDRFDLLLVDNRGTGQSGAIDCKALQHRGTTAANVSACAAQIGPNRDLYRSASVARDLEAVRSALGIGKIDLYAFSWGSVQARAYASRFGDHLRSLVLDSAGQNLDVVAWASERARLHTHQVALLCRRSATCRAVGGRPRAQVAALVARVRRRPVTGTTYDPRRKRVRLRVDEATLRSVFAGRTLVQFPAVGRALARGDKRPLLRMVAEYRFLPASADSGDPAQFSLGDSLAVRCNEQRFPWDWSAAPAARRVQWGAAFAALPPGSLQPFSPGAVSADPQACLDWSAPASSEPPVPDGATYPAAPALFMGGDLDDAVPAVARAYADQFPASTYVEFANVGHGAAFSGGCARAILRRFVSELVTGDVSCAAHASPVFGYSRFPRHARHVRTRVRRMAGDRSRRGDRLAAAAAVETLLDTTIHGRSGHGLRGGMCGVTPTLLFQLRGCRFVEDVAVSGVGSLDVATGLPRVRVRLAGAGTSRGALRIRPRRSNLAVTGKLGRRTVRLLVTVNN